MSKTITNLSASERENFAKEVYHQYNKMREIDRYILEHDDDSQVYQLELLQCQMLVTAMYYNQFAQIEDHVLDDYFRKMTKVLRY